MAHPGGRPKGQPKTGGRQPGSRNKVVVAREEAVSQAYAGLAAALGDNADKLKEISPLSAMLLCLQWAIAARDRNGILAAAAASAPYLHSKMPAQVNLNVTQFAQLSEEELLAEAAQLEQKLTATKVH